MTKKAEVRVRQPDLQNIKFQPLCARLPIERRNAAAREALARRIRSEFQEMRGLSLTPRQASRLFGLSHEVCTRMLVEFEKEELLRLRADGRYVLRDRKL